MKGEAARQRWAREDAGISTVATLDYYRNPNYLTWLRAEASLIDTDGCSAVSGAKVECCYEHDLSYYHARDPRETYKLHRSERVPLGYPDVWQRAPAITFDETNRRFRKCLQARSKLGLWSPMAIWRWLGVQYGARGSWENHRKREAANV